MNAKELNDRLDVIEAKLEKMIEENTWVLEVDKSLEKAKKRLLSAGCTAELLDEFVKAVQPIKQRANTIKNHQRRIEQARKEQQELERKEKSVKEERAKALISKLTMYQTVFPYNTNCRYFVFSDGEALCDVKMDLQYCNNNCPYCTNRAGSYMTDKGGRVVGTRKRGL